MMPHQRLTLARIEKLRPKEKRYLEPDPETAARLRGRRVLAFAGIGRPEKFFATVAACGADVAMHRPFPDHHRFAASDLAASDLVASDFASDFASWAAAVAIPTPAHSRNVHRTRYRIWILPFRKFAPPGLVLIAMGPRGRGPAGAGPSVAAFP